MKTEFERMLVGRFNQLIEEKNNSWLRTIDALNSLAVSWNSYFNETLDLKELAVIFNQHDLSMYISTKFVRKNPKHLDFIENLNVKIEKLIEMVEIPDYNNLLKLAAEAMSSIYPDPARAFDKFRSTKPIKKPIEAITESVFELWKNRIFDGEKFEFTDELKDSITEENSVYTTNMRENAALIFYTKFSELLNVFNDIGHGLRTTDFPIHFHRCLDNKGMYFYPSIYLFKPDWGVLATFNKMTDDEIELLIEKYK